MVDARKVLGQIAPAVGVETALYTCPSNVTANVNITVTNRGKQSTRFSIRLAVADAAVDGKQYIAKDYLLDPNEIVEFNDFDMAATDVLYVTAANDQLTVQAFGIEG